MHTSTPTPLRTLGRCRSLRERSFPAIVIFQKAAQGRVTTSIEEIANQGTVSW
jgi:hypothetical protein